MSDYPVARLGGKTPLQVARKPNIDRLAREGRCGLFRTIEDDMPTGSEAANLSVLGYNPREVLQGRGVLEAASIGVDIQNDEIAMRCNLICLFPDGRIKNHSAGHISSEESLQLVDALNEKLATTRVRFHPGVSYRHLLIWQNGPGSYGRNDADDCAMDAGVLAKAVGKPVRLQYTREQGTAWDPKGPASIHRARACRDYPYGGIGEGMLPPNAAEQVNAPSDDWLQLNNIWAGSRISNWAAGAKPKRSAIRLDGKTSRAVL